MLNRLLPFKVPLEPRLILKISPVAVVAEVGDQSNRFKFPVKAALPVKEEESKEPLVKPVEVEVRERSLPLLKVLAAPVSILSRVPEVTPVEPIYVSVPVKVVLSVKTKPEVVV